MRKTEDSNRTTTNRRHLLALIASGSATALAGCGGDGGDGGDGSDDGGSDGAGGDGGGSDGDDGSDGGDSPNTRTEPEGQPVRTRFRFYNPNSWNPESAQLSPFAVSSDGPWYMSHMYGARLLNMNLNQEPIPFFVDDWEFSDDMTSVTVTYRDDYEFWDGQEITASDVYLHNEMDSLQSFGRKFGNPNEPDDEIVSQTDPIRIRYNQGCSEAGTIILSNTLDDAFVMGKRDHPEIMDFIERLQDASDQNARDEISADLQDWTWGYDYILEEGHGAGLWQPVDWNSERIVHEKYEGHPRSDETNLEEFVMNNIPDAQRIVQEYQQGNLDLASVGDVSGAQDPNGYDLAHQVATNAQLNWRLNQANPHLSKIRVRRALSYAMDFENIVTALEQGNGTASLPIQYHDGASPNIRAQTYGDEWAEENLIDYGSTAQPDQAAALLQEAGYERNGSDVWEHPDDGPIQLQMISNEWGPHAFVSNFLQSQFQEFGIEFDLSVLSFSGYMNTWLESFDYDVATWFQQGAAPHQWWAVWNFLEQGAKWMYLDDVIADSWEAPACADMDNLDAAYPPDLTTDKYPRMDMPIFLEFPAEYGNDDIDLAGDTRNLTPFKCQEMFRRGSEEEVLRCAKDFAWAQNFYRPSIGLFNEIFSYMGNTGELIFPEEGTKRYNTRGNWRFIDEGWVKSRTE